MVRRVGTIGLSEGNGHPFSFSAIINGYDDGGFAEAGWPVIHRYLQAQPDENFGFDGFQVTHAWTQDAELTGKLCRACKIEHAAATVEEVAAEVDAVLIARDDWETHYGLARPFLEAGKHVFVDKPLTLDARELERLAPYLESGRLMSTSGLRYAREIDSLRNGGMAEQLGHVKLIQGTVLFGLEKYGIHLIEAVAGLGGGLERPQAITRLRAEHESFVLEYASGTQFTLNCLGAVGKTFHLSFFGEKGHVHFDLHDNFTAFRRTVGSFFRMVESGRPSIAPSETLRVMDLIMRAKRLKPGQTAELGQDERTAAVKKAA
jgi:predicted dehydrogenase